MIGRGTGLAEQNNLAMVRLFPWTGAAPRAGGNVTVKIAFRAASPPPRELFPRADDWIDQSRRI